MPIRQASYSHRGNNNYGAVIHCPSLVADRLIYFDHDSTTGSWVIRDFIGDVRLDNHHSSLTVAQIEAAATYDEHPPWHNVQNKADWRVYLTLRTTAVFPERPVPTVASNPGPEGWLRL